MCEFGSEEESEFSLCSGDVPSQVKVWLGDNCDHYYVLSRFLLSRMLTVTKVLLHFSDFDVLLVPHFGALDVWLS